MADIHAQKILILDFGSQYTQLIARRVREVGVYSEIRAFDMSETEIREYQPSGIILAGGPESVTAGESPRAPGIVFELGVPVLGICYGMQALAAELGGRTVAGTTREFGYAEVQVSPDSRLLGGLSDHVDGQRLDVWMSHGDKVEALPPGFRLSGRTEHIDIVAMEHETRPLFGVQFHPEVTHTRQGGEILRRFALEICGCEALWTAEGIIDDQIARVRAQVGSAGVLLGLSGGVDSSVVAALLHKAIGEQLTCVFVDTGLLRWQEGDQVMETFARHMGVKVIRVDAAERFFGALAGVDDPEAKRKIIGRLFVEIFEQEANKLQDVAFLAQGTIYPDVIESAGAATGKAHVIKSHHNVGGLPDYMKLELASALL